ncbi:MAG: hypothetical protein WCA00_13420 [Candidatus Acidiferrales bacterium]
MILGKVLVRQAVRTATAGVVALNHSRILGLPGGCWEAITAVIVLQVSLFAELSAFCAGAAAGLSQLAQGLSSKQFPASDFDFRQITQTLDTKAAKLYNNRAIARHPLQAALRSDTLCLAMQALASELAEALATTRGAKL